MEIFNQITLIRSEKFKRHYRSLGLNPPRGLLLWGPPGTGKTKVARIVGDILGVPDDRCRFIVASELLDKYVGETEKKIRELFENAREDQEKLGDSSPLHVLIIDEIDVLGSRETAVRSWEISHIDELIANIDGGKEPLNNILVIGLTNRPDSLDSAIKRPGRLGIHIHIGLPTKEGRIEIFKIHSKKIIDNEFISADVDWEVLGDMTLGRTGAFIEGVVKKAAMKTVPRLNDNNVSKEEFATHPLAMVTMEDFKVAIRESIGADRIARGERAFVPSVSYTKETITADLRRLGFVGVPDEIITFIQDIKISQHFRDDRKKMELELPTATMIFGPPGTGKSSIMKALEMLFELDSNRFKYYCASQLWQKYGRDLRKEIQKIMEPAINAAGDLKGDVPLHVIVLDEIDWLYGKHGKDAPTLLSEFMHEVKALFDLEGVTPKNLLVIGIAPQQIPSGLVKTFNVGSATQVIEMKFPNDKQRAEIFKYYLRNFIDAGRVDENVLSEMVPNTRNKPGAFIMKLVKVAGNLMYRRGAENEIPKEELATHPLGKLTLADFQEAYGFITGSESWKNNYL